MPKHYEEDQIKKPDLTPALMVWAKRHNVTPIKFSRSMKWSYSYAYSVIKGKVKFLPAAWGDFMLVYGVNVLLELFKIAGVNPNGGEG